MRLLLKNLLFTLIVPATVAGYLPWMLTRNSDPGSFGWMIISSIFFVVGGFIYASCVWEFARFGRGTPAPMDAPKRLVTHGLHAYIRNPMYVGVECCLLGWVFLFKNLMLLLIAACLGVLFHLFVIRYEEPHLRKLFGADYDDYCLCVGRWLPKKRYFKSVEPEFKMALFSLRVCSILLTALSFCWLTITLWRLFRILTPNKDEWIFCGSGLMQPIQAPAMMSGAVSLVSLFAAGFSYRRLSKPRPRGRQIELLLAGLPLLVSATLLYIFQRYMYW